MKVPADRAPPKPGAFDETPFPPASWEEWDARRERIEARGRLVVLCAAVLVAAWAAIIAGAFIVIAWAV